MEILPAPQGPRMLLSRSPISKCTSVFSEDLGRATEKRINEHNSGRALLEKSLEHWGLEISSLEVRRDENRAPYLSWIEGTWNNSPLPGISIGHSGNWAVCAIIEAGWWIGIDSEPTDRGIQENAFDWLDAPISRVTGLDVPLPYAENLEKMALPQVEDIVQAALSICNRLGN